MAYASLVLDHAPDLADLVLSGAKSLDDAYAEARQRKAETEGEAAKMARLRAEAPDLADLVAEERQLVDQAENQH